MNKEHYSYTQDKTEEAQPYIIVLKFQENKLLLLLNFFEDFLRYFESRPPSQRFYKCGMKCAEINQG